MLAAVVRRRQVGGDLHLNGQSWAERRVFAGMAPWICQDARRADLVVEGGLDVTVDLQGRAGFADKALPLGDECRTGQIVLVPRIDRPRGGGVMRQDHRSTSLGVLRCLPAKPMGRAAMIAVRIPGGGACGGRGAGECAASPPSPPGKP